MEVNYKKACSYNYSTSNDQLLIPLGHLKKINKNRDEIAKFKFTTDFNNYNSTDVKYPELANQYLLESGISANKKYYFAIYESAHAGGISRFVLIVKKKGNQILYKELSTLHNIDSWVDFCSPKDKVVISKNN